MKNTNTINLNKYRIQALLLTLTFIMVSNAVAGIATISLNDGQINGQNIDAVDNIITVSPGEVLSGSINITSYSGYDSPTGSIYTEAASAIWGDRGEHVWTISSHGGYPGTREFTVNIPSGLTAPTDLGLHYIVMAGAATFTANEVMSATGWMYSGPDMWDDGNDLGWDWTPEQFREAHENGFTTTRWLSGDYPLDPPSSMAANWVGVNVVPEPATLFLLALGGLTLRRKRRV